jgi:hypothetical protein
VHDHEGVAIPEHGCVVWRGYVRFCFVRFTMEDADAQVLFQLIVD